MAASDAGSGEDLKPEAGVSKHIQLKVKDQHENETFFKVKPTMSLDKLKMAYAQQKGVEVTSLRFLFDGQLIVPRATPQQLEIEEGDMIRVFLEQHGSGSKLI